VVEAAAPTPGEVEAAAPTPGEVEAAAPTPGEVEAAAAAEVEAGPVDTSFDVAALEAEVETGTEEVVEEEVQSDFPDFSDEAEVERVSNMKLGQEEAAAAATPEDEIAPDAKKTSGVGDPAAQPNPIYAAMRNARQAIEYIKKNTTDKLFKNLANRLAPLMGNTKFVVVTDPETQIANPVVRDLFNSGDTQGVYEESSDTMYLHSEKGLTEEVILHEATHKGTVAKIKIFLNNDPTNVGLTNKEVAVLEKISDLRLEAYKVYKAKERAGTLTQAEINLYNAGAFTNLYEFVAYGRTNEQMQQVLNDTPGTDGKSTLFAQFVELLRQLFNIPASQKMRLWS
jgi:hypothetical protein